MAESATIRQEPTLDDVRSVVRQMQLQEFLCWPNQHFWTEWERLLDLLGLEPMYAPPLKEDG